MIRVTVHCRAVPVASLQLELDYTKPTFHASAPGSESAAAATLARRLIQRPSRDGVVPDRMPVQAELRRGLGHLASTSCQCSLEPDSASDPHSRSSVVALRTTRIEARADAAHAID